MTVIRRGGPADLDDIERIQAASPEAAHWDPTDYLRYDLHVAICDGQLAGFLVARTLCADECEILNLAVAPEWRRRRVGRRLLETFRKVFSGTIFLEVRESNRNAREFYKSLDFKEVSLRPGYYLSPTEPAIVMKFHSC